MAHNHILKNYSDKTCFDLHVQPSMYNVQQLHNFNDKACEEYTEYVLKTHLAHLSEIRAILYLKYKLSS